MMAAPLKHRLAMSCVGGRALSQHRVTTRAMLACSGVLDEQGCDYLSLLKSRALVGTGWSHKTGGDMSTVSSPRARCDGSATPYLGT